MSGTNGGKVPRRGVRLPAARDQHTPFRRRTRNDSSRGKRTIGRCADALHSPRPSKLVSAASGPHWRRSNARWVASAESRLKSLCFKSSATISMASMAARGSRSCPARTPRAPVSRSQQHPRLLRRRASPASWSNPSRTTADLSSLDQRWFNRRGNRQPDPD